MYDRDQGDLALGELREGLRALRVPEPSPEFDLRVLAALREQRKRQVAWRVTFLPALLGAVASCALILLIAQGLLQTPAPAGVDRIHVGTVPDGAVDALDKLLGDPATSEPALSRLSICGGWVRLLRDAGTPDSVDGDRTTGPRSDLGAQKRCLA